MGQQQKQNEAHHTELQAVLSGLDAKINGLDVAIASMMAEQHTLKRTREYVMSTHDKAPITLNGNNTPADSAPKLPMRPTYLSRSPIARKSRSSLRQEVLIRNAMEREKSSSPPGSVGLLSSVEFEASFPDHNIPSSDDDSNADGCGGYIDARGDVRPSVEGISSSSAEKHPATSSITTTNTFSRSNTPSPASETNAFSSSSRNGPGAHWRAKRATKRKRQENAAKAREVRRRNCVM